MTPASLDNAVASRWPHRLALATACATFPLVWVGGLVTTQDAGMAVPDWPNTYGYNLFLYPWQTWFYGPFDVFIEHGHRLLGAAVGILTIAMAVGLWRGDRRQSVRWLGWVALAAVIVQGSLGGARVLLNERTLAMIHGSFGPAFFCLIAGLVIVTAPRWQSSEPATTSAATGRVQRLAVLTSLLAYAQLFVGANLRHLSLSAAPSAGRALAWFHIGLAAVLVWHAVLLVVAVGKAGVPGLVRRPAWLLMVLLAVQPVLGVMTWVFNYGWPIWTERFGWSAAHTIHAQGLYESFVITAHQATGSLIVATALVVSLRAWRWLAPVTRSSGAVHHGALRGAKAAERDARELLVAVTWPLAASSAMEVAR
ncbi:MAG: COX15/CtaA family protein [Pirellulales bacterium]|nr:COX15/CtaA family protein [Pirellulales bacterium]